MVKISKLLIICSLLTTLTGCQKTEQPKPAFNITGLKTSIAKIQISPIAFDGAQVVVLGFVKEIRNLKNEQKTLVLSDEYGNSIKVEFTTDPSELNKNDTIIVGGKYRKNTNVIESEKVIKVTVTKDGIKPSGDFDKAVNKR